MNRFSIFYLLSLFCISFAPAQARRNKLCKLTSASVLDTTNQSESRTFNGRSIHLYKSFKANVEKTYYQVEDGSGKKSLEFQMNPRSSVFIENEITAVYGSIKAKLTLDGDTSTFYRNEISLDDFSRDLHVVQFTVDGNTLDITSIKVRQDPAAWIFVAVNDNTPRLVFPSHSVKSMSYNSLYEEMSFSIEVEAHKRVPIFVEFETIADAQTFHRYVQRTI